ncbi:hypothetical protein G6F46_015408 [Rhizopus delemar]|nr:hypothetical protein G6F35_014631 [Rhizopus arrhizus]KAG1581121.1 hypothetical protein G6F46_015408 [Rhizopus delemar]
MQIQHRGRARLGALPVPGAHLVAVGQRQVVDLGAGGGFAPPGLRFGLGREDRLALPGVQLRAAHHAGGGKQGGDEKPAGGESGQGGHENYDPVGSIGFRHQDTPGCSSRVSASHACAACDR